ncbi:MAG: hypothetical protein ACK55I_24985, partial [bacterium]
AKIVLVGSEGALGGNKEAIFGFNLSQEVELAKATAITKLADYPRERSDKINIENSQIFSNIAYPNPIKNSHIIFEFFQNLKSSNSDRKSHMQA